MQFVVRFSLNWLSILSVKIKVQNSILWVMGVPRKRTVTDRTVDFSGGNTYDKGREVDHEGQP